MLLFTQIMKISLGTYLELIKIHLLKKINQLHKNLELIIVTCQLH